MTTTPTCRDCGSPLSSSTLHGKCPRCSARIGFEFALGSDSEEHSTGEGGADFGEFVLLNEVGRGGMGVVYRAKQRSLNRTVALKMILGGRFASEDQVRRFYTEAESAAALHHPNIVSIFEVGEHEGQHYFAMEYVEGSDLTKLVEQSPLPEKEAAALVQTITEAVHYAHQEGVIHRDLKPSNILLDQRGDPQISDFGLAKRLGDLDPDSSSAQLTLSGQVMGSPSFAAPEQIDGRSKESGREIDIYALGALLYFLLSGRPPFLADSLDHTLSLVISTPAPSPRLLNPNLARDLETICLKCLEKDPERRYASASDLAADLARFGSGQPISARPVSSLEKMRRWAKRNPLPASLALISLLILLVGSIGIVSQWQRAERHAQNEEQERERAESTLSTLQIQHAELRLQRGEVAEGLAYLAHVLRKDPHNRIAAQRLLSVLNHHSFALPSAPPLLHAKSCNSATWSADGSLLVTTSDDHTAQIWTAADSKAQGSPLLHQEAVLVAAFNPDASQVATATEGGSVRIWATESGSPLSSNLEHSSPVTSVHFHPSKPLLLSGTQSGTVHLWDLESTKEVHPNSLEKFDTLTGLQFSPDGSSFLACGRYDRKIRVFETRSGKIKHRGNINRSNFEIARFSPSGERIAMATYDGKVHLWNMAERKIVKTLRLEGVATDVSFSPDGTLLATASWSRRVAVWNLETGELVREFPNHKARVQSVTFSPDGLKILSVEYRRRAHVWDLLTGEPTVEPFSFNSDLNGFSFDSTGEKVVSATSDGRAQVWDIRDGRAWPLVFAHPGRVISTDVQDDGQRMIASSDDGTVSVWDTKTGQEIAHLPFEHCKVALAPNGKFALLAATAGSVVFWNLEHGGSKRATHGRRIIHVEISRDGKRGLTAGFDGTAQVWDLEKAERVCPPLKHPARLWFASLSPDGSRVVTGTDHWNTPGGEDYAQIWNAETGEPSSPKLRHDAGIHQCVFSPDGNQVLTASIDHTAALWDTKSGKKLQVFQHKSAVKSALFDQRGERIVTASWDNTARVWNALTGEALTPPMPHAHELRHAEFSPDGSSIVTACNSGVARIWDSLTGNPLTPPLPHNDLVHKAQFSPDGDFVLSNGHQARLWDVSQPSLPVPSTLPELAEAIGSLHISDTGLTSSPLFGNSWNQKEQLLGSSYSRWATWFFGDRRSRSLSPNLSPTVASLEEKVVPSQTLESSILDIRLHPKASSSWSRFSEELSDSQNEIDLALGEYAGRKAILLDPGDPELWINHCQHLASKEKLAQFRSTLEEALLAHPENADLHTLSADSHFDEDEFEEALKNYEQVIALIPDRLATPYVKAADRARACRLALALTEQAQQEWLLAKGIPKRPSTCPQECVDLSSHYNAALDEPWHNRNWKGNDLAPLLKPINLSEDIPFDLRGVIQVTSRKLSRVAPGFPNEVKGIPLQRKSTTLHFLHGSAWGFAPKDGAVVGNYRVHYEDGKTLQIPLVKNENIHEWHIENWPNEHLSAAQRLDLGTNAGKARIRLFLFTWSNPRPEAEIRTIDVVGGSTDTAPFLVALTADEG